MVLTVPYFTQNRAYTCGPAALRMLLAFYGIDVSEDELVLHTRASFLGTCNDVLTETATLFRGCLSSTNLTLDGLRGYIASGVPVLVNYINPVSEQGHFAVLVGHSDSHLILNDPHNGEGYMIEHGVFEKRWVSGDGLHHRWGMVFVA